MNTPELKALLDKSLDQLGSFDLFLLILKGGGPNSKVTPELEAAINAVSAQATKVDQQVPDSPRT